MNIGAKIRDELIAELFFLVLSTPVVIVGSLLTGLHIIVIMFTESIRKYKYRRHLWKSGEKRPNMIFDN